MPDPSLTQSVQDYLKAMYAIATPGRAVTTNELAQELDVAPASVTGMIKRLSKEGYLEYRPRRGVELTSKGLQAALETIRHHRLLELFFVRRLGMDWAQAHREAETLEHFISEELESLIDAEMGHPAYDPHGSPIPTREGDIPADSWQGLLEVEVGGTYVIRRIQRAHAELQQYVQNLGLVPGARLRLVEIGPFDGPVTIECGGRTHHIGRTVAATIRVERVAAESEGTVS